MSKEQPIIFTKKHKRHKPHSGGWKVAFADLMVALMAFFFLLWILEASSIEERQTVVQNLRKGIPVEEESILETANLSIIDFGATGGKERGDMGPLVREDVVDEGSGSEEGGGAAAQASEATAAVQRSVQLIKLIKNALSQQYGAGKIAEHVRFEARDDGLRIALSDNVEQLMFRRGSDQMEPFFQDLLLTVAELLRPYSQQLLVSGHTDSSKFTGDGDNWRLSTNRALQARRALEIGGIPNGQFLHVAGYADTIPLDENKPKAIANRRIELFILNGEAVTEIIERQRRVTPASQFKIPDQYAG